MRRKVAGENMQNDVWLHDGAGRGPKMDVAANKSKDDTKTSVKQKIHTNRVCTRQGGHCLRGVTARSAHNMGASRTWLGQQWRQGLAERETSWKQSLARKWGTSVVAVLDMLGRSAGPTVPEIAVETRGWSNVDTDGPLEKTRKLVTGLLHTFSYSSENP